MSNSAVGLFISRNLPAYSSAPTQRAAQEIRSRNAPLLDADDFVRAGDVAATIVTGITNKQRDRADEELDSKRVSGGKTIEEFLK